MSWRSIDEAAWRSIDETPALSPPAAKASTYVAEFVLLAALALGAGAWWLRSGPAEDPPPVEAAPAEVAVVEPPPPPPPPPPPEPPAPVVEEPPPPPPLEAPAPDPIVAVPLPPPVVLVVPPLPARSAEGDAYLREWRSAAARAAQRDLDGAAALIKKAGRGSEELRREAAADLADLDRLRAFEERARRKFAASRKGSRVELERRGAGAISGEVLAAGPERLELRSGQEAVFVELADLSWSSLAKLGDEDVRALGLAWLLDGRREEAWTAAGRRVDAFEPKHWRLPRPDAPAELEASEREARRLLYEAERAYRAPGTRASAVGKYRVLLAEFPETSLVRRSLDRVQGRAKAPEEVYFGAPDLRGSGSFELGKEGWKTAGPVDFHKARFSFVEAEFEVEPGMSYRVFARVGGCCAENLRIYGQASGLEKAHPGRGVKVAVEPGSIYATILRKPEALPKEHEPGHPLVWGWTELPLPSAAQGGTKRVRILTEREGLGVSGLLVTKSRTVPPADAELPALEASRRVE